MRRLLALLLVAAFVFSIVPDANAAKRAKKARSAKSAKSAKKAKSSKSKKFLFFGGKTAQGWDVQLMA